MILSQWYLASQASPRKSRAGESSSGDGLLTYHRKTRDLSQGCSVTYEDVGRVSGVQKDPARDVHRIRVLHAQELKRQHRTYESQCHLIDYVLQLGRHLYLDHDQLGLYPLVFHGHRPKMAFKDPHH